MVRTSTVNKAQSISRSLRTTIPSEIVDDLGLKIGDTLTWDISEREGKKGVFVRKME